jgi:hypothetical protein
MTLNFPNAPTNGQIFEGYQYNTAKGVWARTNFSALEASTTNPGIVQLATAAEMLAGAATTRAVTPVGLSPLQVGYRLVETLYVTANTNFIKANYPWLRAIRVKCQAGGGSGGGCNTTVSGQVAAGKSAAGGVYSESFITNILGLAASVAVTVGAGGAVTTAPQVGLNGGDSSFGALVTAQGGGAGGSQDFSFSPNHPAGTTLGPTSGVGDFILFGGSSMAATSVSSSWVESGMGGGSHMSQPVPGVVVIQGVGAGGSNGSSGRKYGGGGTGGANTVTGTVARSGGAGAPGIVIIELYA